MGHICEDDSLIYTKFKSGTSEFAYLLCFAEGGKALLIRKKGETRRVKKVNFLSAIFRWYFWILGCIGHMPCALKINASHVQILPAIWKSNHDKMYSLSTVHRTRHVLVSRASWCHCLTSWRHRRGGRRGRGKCIVVAQTNNCTI